MLTARAALAGGEASAACRAGGDGRSPPLLLTPFPAEVGGELSRGRGTGMLLGWLERGRGCFSTGRAAGGSGSSGEAGPRARRDAGCWVLTLLPAVPVIFPVDAQQKRRAAEPCPAWGLRLARDAGCPYFGHPGAKRCCRVGLVLLCAGQSTAPGFAGVMAGHGQEETSPCATRPWDSMGNQGSWSCGHSLCPIGCCASVSPPCPHY